TSASTTRSARRVGTTTRNSMGISPRASSPATAWSTELLRSRRDHAARARGGRLDVFHLVFGRVARGDDAEQGGASVGVRAPLAGDAEAVAFELRRADREGSRGGLARCRVARGR